MCLRGSVSPTMGSHPEWGQRQGVFSGGGWGRPVWKGWRLGFGPYAMVLPPSRILAPIWALLKTCFAGRQNVLRALSVFSKVVCAPSQLVLMHGEWGGERELERERGRENSVLPKTSVPSPWE